MIGLSIAIAAVILVMMGMGVRAGKKGIVPMSLPFLCIPIAVLVVEALLYSLRSMTQLPLSALRSIGVLIGALAGAVIGLVVSQGFQGKKSQKGYMVFSLVFLIALAFGYYLQIH